MHTPLSQDRKLLAEICAHFSLGEAQQALEPVSGGFHHRMWRLRTEQGAYAIKQLADDTHILDDRARQHFELTETVAERFSQHAVPAVFAHKAAERYVFVQQEQGFLVYPWIEARALARDEITPDHIQVVAALFARMHRADVQAAELRPRVREVHEEDKLSALVAFARSRNSSRSEELSDKLPLFQSLVARHNSAIDALSGHTVISHGDLDHKNILWTSRRDPFLVDWESAGPVNPTHEVVLEALDWSGITLDFNESLFDCFIASYLRAGGDGRFNEVEAAFDCVLGDWVNWLMYNVGRSIELSDAAQRQLGLEQVDMAMATLARLDKLVPKLLRKLKS